MELSTKSMCYRLLDTGILSAAENITLDSVLLTARAEGRSPNTLRFLQFSPPAVLIGYHQTVEQEVRIGFCRQHSIDINRRITGGGAIYFDKTQLGWEVVADRKDLGYSLQKITKNVGEAVVCGLKRLGVSARFRGRNDIEVDGRKISGTGGVFEDNAVLFQGTLLIEFDVESMMKALRIPVEKLSAKEIESVKDRVVSLKEILRESPPISEIKKALCEGFCEVFGIELEKGALSSYEEELFSERLPKFSSDTWIRRIKEPVSFRQSLSSVYKTEEALIRCSALFDTKRRILKQVFFTGDFFLSPERAVFDLEAELKDTPCDEVKRKIERFFSEREVETELKAFHFTEPLLSAIEKLRYTELGFSLSDAENIIFVRGRLSEILGSPRFLLLPYCAKSIDCKYRDSIGCDMCRRCSVGIAYKMAEDRGIIPITICNFEHLKRTLKALSAPYIGCCCRDFFAKHQDVFITAKVPGVLLNIENRTCYDLGREREGLLGRFENQTELKIDLLKRCLSVMC